VDHKKEIYIWNVSRHYEQLKRLSFAALKAQYTSMGVPLDPTMGKDDIIQRLQDLRLWEELPLASLRKECLDQQAVAPEAMPSSGSLQSQKNMLIELLFARSCERAWESQGLPVSALGGFQGTAQVLKQYEHLESLHGTNMKQEYKRLGLPDEDRVDRKTMVMRLKQVTLWQCLPPGELRAECKRKELTINETEMAELEDDEQRSTTLVWRLIVHQYMSAWEILGLPVQRLGNVDAVMQAIGNYQFYDEMGVSDLKKAYLNVGFPEETGLEKQDLLTKLKRCVIWELLPLDELRKECTSLQVSNAASDQSSSEDDMHGELLQRLLVYLCQDEYELKGIPARRLGSMSLVRHIAERFEGLEAMTATELKLEASKLGLPVRQNVQRLDLLIQLKDVAVWSTLPLDELRRECVTRAVSMKGVNFDIETGDEEARNQVLGLLLFQAFTSTFESLGIPAQTCASFQACSGVAQAWAAIDKLTSAEITRRYMELGCSPVQHVIRLDSALMADRLKKIALWMEIPLLEIQKECRTHHINSIAREGNRDELVLRLVAVLWAPKVFPPKVGGVPPCKPGMPQRHAGGPPQAPPSRGLPRGMQGRQSPGQHWKAHMPPGSGPWSPGKGQSKGKLPGGYSPWSSGGVPSGQQGKPKASPHLSLHYQTLCVQPTAGAEEVKKAYRTMALKYHPDKNQGVGQEQAANQFRKVSEAYQALSEHLKIK